MTHNLSSVRNWRLIAWIAAASWIGALSSPAMTREERIQWWREARFGLFIHWGLYAIPAGTWKDKVYQTGYSEWILFEEKIPNAEYGQLAGKFNPAKFDATQWASLARKAGMKYVVLTAKHHDGFSMFDSKLTDYDVVDATPFKRDVTGELAAAFRASGLRFGCYYSVDRDWRRPQGPGNSYKQTNTWDYPDSKQSDFDQYFSDFAKPQVEEILTKYKPDVLWFDDIDMKSETQVDDIYQTVRTLQPACVINSRIRGCRPPKSLPPPHSDYLSTGDNEIADRNIGFEWENPGSMNTSYGYNAHDHNWVSGAEIVRRLVDIVSKGGNYLLNVGPTAEGLIPQPCIDSLTEVGAWLETNGEAIYGTMPWRIFRDTGKTADIRFTAKGDALYAIGLDLPEKEVMIKDLGKASLTDKTITSVRILGTQEPLAWKQTDEALMLPAPEKKSASHALVYRIDFKE